MTDYNSNTTSDIRGAKNLTIDMVKGITDIVESMHQTISSLSGVLGKQEQNQTSGITKMVYKNIRTISELTGNGFDLLLDKLSLIIPQKESSPGREAVLSALNGVLGDYLDREKNPLVIPMQLRKDGRPISINDPAFFDLIKQSNKKIVLLVHGSCMNDLQWSRHGHNHGTALANELGFFPIYLHYNTGRHISENGKDFADLIEIFVNQLPWSIELMIIAHSMGGLVSRSACHYGKISKHKGPKI